MKVIVLAILIIAPIFIVAPCTHSTATNPVSNVATPNCNTCVPVVGTETNGLVVSCATCNVGFYKNTASPVDCVACTSDCNVCTTGTTCTTCKANFNKYTNGATETCVATCPATTFAKSGICVTDCGDGFYKDNPTSTCKPCLTGCFSCTSALRCTKCANDQLLT